MKKMDPGRIPNPWEYSDDVNQLRFKNSVDAYKFFRSKIEIEGEVMLAFCKINHPAADDILCWIYLFKRKETSSVAVANVFVDDQQLLRFVIPNKYEFTDNFLIQCDDGFYESIATTSSEVAIRRIKSILSEKKVLKVLNLQGLDVVDLYPVEIFSPKAKGAICVCWSVTLRDTPEVANWFPVSYDDVNALNGYTNSDLHEFPIEINQSVTIGKKPFILKYNKDKGRYFIPKENSAQLVRDKDNPKIIHFIPPKSNVLN
jgi:hypothetical protein